MFCCCCCCCCSGYLFNFLFSPSYSILSVWFCVLNFWISRVNNACSRRCVSTFSVSQFAQILVVMNISFVTPYRNICWIRFLIHPIHRSVGRHQLHPMALILLFSFAIVLLDFFLPLLRSVQCVCVCVMFYVCSFENAPCSRHFTIDVYFLFILFVLFLLLLWIVHTHVFASLNIFQFTHVQFNASST